MSKLSEEIRDNLRNFTEPMRNEIESMKYAVSDRVYDMTHNSDEASGEGESNVHSDAPQPSNNKKSSNRIIIYAIIIALIIGMIHNCTEDDEASNSESDGETHIVTDSNVADQTEDESFFTAEQQEVVLEHIAPHLAYAKEQGIKALRFPKEEKALWNWLNSFTDDSAKYLEFEENMFSGNYYKRTEKIGDYLYFGELKDNRPHGYGVLYKINRSGEYSWYTYYDEKSDWSYNYDRYYVGHFSEGNFDGYGLLYSVEEGGYKSIINRLTKYGSEATDEAVANYYALWGNPICYFGMFSDGKRYLGNYFGLWNLDSLPDNHDITKTKYVLIEVGEFNGENLNGYGIEYWGDYLHYEGEYSDGKYNGDGRLYYFQSNQVEYEGGFRNNKRHGYGKSYSETGKLVYEGEWENDDYK